MTGLVDFFTLSKGREELRRGLAASHLQELSQVTGQSKFLDETRLGLKKVGVPFLIAPVRAQQVARAVICCLDADRHALVVTWDEFGSKGKSLAQDVRQRKNRHSDE
jgi:hypothetical protein